MKPEAFVPEEGHRETSVFRHLGEPLDALWALAANVIGNESPRRVHGAALLATGAVRRAELEVIADEPPIRHAAIRGWPWTEDPKLRKAAHKERSAILASAAGAPLLLET